MGELSPWDDKELDIIQLLGPGWFPVLTTIESHTLFWQWLLSKPK